VDQLIEQTHSVRQSPISRFALVGSDFAAGQLQAGWFRPTRHDASAGASSAATYGVVMFCRMA
jgi:hypothetical protein